jgi:hypothetical protein
MEGNDRVEIAVYVPSKPGGPHGDEGGFTHTQTLLVLPRATTPDGEDRAGQEPGDEGEGLQDDDPTPGGEDGEGDERSSFRYWRSQSRAHMIMWVFMACLMISVLFTTLYVQSIVHYEIRSCARPVEIAQRSVAYGGLTSSADARRPFDVEGLNERGGGDVGNDGLTVCPRRSGLYAFSFIAKGLRVRDHEDFHGMAVNRFDVVAVVSNVYGGIVMSKRMVTNSIADPASYHARTLSATGKLYAFLVAGDYRDGERMCYTPSLRIEHTFMMEAWSNNLPAGDACCHADTFSIRSRGASLCLVVKLVDEQGDA